MSYARLLCTGFFVFKLQVYQPNYSLTLYDTHVYCY